jgi:hypothetical protein
MRRRRSVLWVVVFAGAVAYAATQERWGSVLTLLLRVV